MDAEEKGSAEFVVDSSRGQALSEVGNSIESSGSLKIKLKSSLKSHNRGVCVWKEKIGRVEPS